MIRTFTFIILFTIAGSLTAQNTINNSFYFEDGPNTTWVKLIEMTTASDGVDSQAEQTLVLNISSLPTGGANYRVVKTVSNGNWNNGSAQALQVGSNSISVAGVSFDRAVKVQFSGESTEFSSLSVNGTTLNLSHIVENNFEIYPNPAVDKISVRQIDNIRTIKVYNSLGSLVKEVRNTNEVDVSELSKGVHFLQVDNGNLTTRKFIKK